MRKGKDSPILKFSLEKAKEYCLEYKKTKDSYLYSRLIARFEKSIRASAMKYQRDKSIIYPLDLRDLYHTALLGVEKAILSVSEDTPPKMIGVKFYRYSYLSIRKTYNNVFRLIQLDPGQEFDVFHINNGLVDLEYKYNLLKLHLTIEGIPVLRSICENEIEYRVMYEYYYLEKTFSEISKNLNMSWSYPRHVRSRVLKRLFKKYNNFKDFITDNKKVLGEVC